MSVHLPECARYGARLWLAQWTPSRGLPQPDRLREIARDSASFEDTSAKEALNGIVKGLAE